MVSYIYAKYIYTKQHDDKYSKLFIGNFKTWTHIKKQYYTQQKYDQQYHSQYHCQDTPLDRKRSRLLNNYQNDATPLLQCGNPSDTTRRSTPQSHRRYYEANAIHNPHENGVVKPPDPGV